MWKGVVKKVNWRYVLILGIAFILVVSIFAAYLYERSENERLRSEAAQIEAAQSTDELSEEDRESVTLYTEALKAVRKGYVDRASIDSEDQAYSAIKGMLDSLGDKRHTRFLTPEEVEKTREALSSKRIDTGVQLEDRGDEVVALAPLSGSPAEVAGIEPGDVVVGVDGQSVRGENVTEVADRLKGPEGSQVGLTVLRDGAEREFSLERIELKVPAAYWNLIPGTDMAHIRLALFSENSAAELDEAFAAGREAGAKRFVLDFRENTGGKVDQAEKVASQLLPAERVIYIRRDADGREKETKVPDGNEPLDAPLVVLVNGKSASGTEIVAGALQDNGRAKVVGETTYGTGTVLDDFPLSDGSAILLAVAEWLTPNGEPILETGIEPDVEVSLEQGQRPRTPDELRGLSGEEIFEEDAQLESAFEVLQNA